MKHNHRHVKGDLEKQVARVVGANVRRCRHTRGWIQRQLADACGLHAANVCSIELGLRTPELPTLVRMAAALKVPVTALLDGLQFTRETS